MSLKRTISLILVLCLCAALVPVKAEAVTYASYPGVDFLNANISSQRKAALTKAMQMVTVLWTCPADFPTWRSSGGVLNTVTATDGTSSTKFIGGKQYTGIPYSMADHSFDDVAWANAIANGKITTSYMTGSYYGNGDTTAHGSDCSYFVYLALKAADAGNIEYLNTRDMLQSSLYSPISWSGLKPADLFLKNGHVMMFVGMSGNNYAVFEATADDSKCSYNVYTKSQLSSYTCYRYNNFSTNDSIVSAPVDVGTNFYALIIHTSTWAYVTNDSNNVSVRSGTGYPDQVWYFERLDDGSYKITSVLDGYSLDVYDAGTSEGTNVQTYPYNGNSAQQWYISGSSGAYVFRAKCADTVLDVNNNSSEEGTNVQMWTPNGTDAQLFSIWKLDDYTTGHPSATSYTNVGTNFYALIIHTSTWAYVTNDSNNVSVRSGTADPNQVWYFERLDDGSYKITSVLDGSCLEVCNFGTTDGTNVQTNVYGANTAQQWYISGSSGAQVFRAKSGDTVLDVTGNSDEDGTNVQMWTPNGTDAQLFHIWKLDDYKTGHPTAKTYSNVGTNFYALIIHTSTWAYVTNDSNNVSVRSGTADPNQAWYFERLEDGSYKITSVLDGYSLDVYGAGTSEGTNVQTYPYNGTSAQQWYVSGSSGAYVFRAKCADTVMEVCNNSAEEGANVQMMTPNGTDAQLFQIWILDDYDTVAPSCSEIALSQSQCGMTDGNYSIQDSITVTWHADNADSYWLQIKNDQDGSYVVNEGTTATLYTFTPPAEGSYTVAIHSYNEAGDGGRTERTLCVRSIVSETWVSDSMMGEKKASFPAGTTIFFNYELFDPNTHDLLYTFSTMDTYVTLSIIDPSGSVIHTQTFNNDDTDYISCVCTESGTYTAQVDLWGSVYQSKFTIETYVEQVASGWSGNTTWVLTSDGVLTFSGNGNMKNYDWSGGQPWLDYADQITSVVVEEGVTGVGSGAFMNLTRLESVTLPETGLSKIGEAAFYGCTALTSIDIPDTIYTVFDYTFKNCTSLADVHLSRELIKVGQGAFENCTALTYVYIPGNTEIIGSWSFKSCTGLAEVDMTWADATEIREGAFKNCSALTTIHLPGNIQTLGDSCFYGIGATSFTVPETVTTVKAWCFARASLTEITFEGDAPTIGEGAFNKITLTAYYPSGNATWTSDIMQNYGGTITWTAK